MPKDSFERIININLGDKAGSLVIVLPSEKIIEDIFKNIKIGYFEAKLNDLISSHWIISGEKRK